MPSALSPPLLLRLDPRWLDEVYDVVDVALLQKLADSVNKLAVEGRVAIVKAR